MNLTKLSLYGLLQLVDDTDPVQFELARRLRIDHRVKSPCPTAGHALDAPEPGELTMLDAPVVPFKGGEK